MLAPFELQTNATAFWSLTEQGALACRAKQYNTAIELVEQSLQADAKPGTAVLNWLWLALAYQKLGAKVEGRYWLDKAGAWLDSLGGSRPADAETKLGLHRHNWLEAHVLRHEAEALFLPSSKK
jgi:hypothetical protein